ncbi:tetratricopeptide repeat protein [Parabacteroides sp. 52]|nr:tetratricopeptide repeat protein [Parabacteroides sp. 52]
MRHKQNTIIWMIAFLLCHGVVFAQKAERKNVREGNKLYHDEKYTESEIAFRKSVDVNPRSTEGMYNLGNALYKQNKLPEAAEQYQLVAGQGEKLLQTEEGKAHLSEVYHNTGNIFMQNKDYGKSVEAYKQALRLNPKDDETRYNLALAQKLLQDQQNEDQNQDQQNEDKDKDEKKEDENKDQQQDQQQQQQQDENKEDKTQEQEQPNEQMSQDNAQQILDAFLQDEKDTQEKVKQAQQQQQERRRSEKEW